MAEVTGYSINEGTWFGKEAQEVKIDVRRELR